MSDIFRKHQTMFVAIFLAALTFGAFCQVLRCDFVNLDDNVYVTDNQHVKAGLAIEGLRWALNIGYAGNWHPLTWISHMADWQLFDGRAEGHHAVNLLLHIANVLLLFGVLMRMTKSLWRSAFVAALFAVHPLHVESVAWVAERKDVLSALFWLLTMWAYVRYAERPAIQRYVPVVVLFALGLMAKPMLVTLPIVLLLIDYWPLGRSERFSKLLLEKVPLLVLATGSCVLTFVAQVRGGAVASIEHFTLGERTANALASYVGYARAMFWPRGLAAYYPYQAYAFGLIQVIGFAVALAVLTVLAIRLARSRGYLAVGWLWYLITLVPVIGLVQVGAQAMADRYTYIPLIGLFILIAWGIPDALSRARPLSHTPTLPVLAGLAIALLTTLTWVQVGYWHDSETLFTHALRVTNNNYIAHLNLGVALADKGDLQGAADHLEEAIRLDPNPIQVRMDLAAVLGKQGKLEEAIQQYREIVKANPNSAAAYYNLGLALERQRKLDETIGAYQHAIGLKPDYPQAHKNLAIALYFKGDFAGAWREVHQCLKYGGRPHPGFVQALSKKMRDPGR